MRAFWIAVDVVVGLCIGGVLYAVAAALVPRITGMVALAVILAACVLLMLVRYPGGGRRSLTTDLDTLVPPLMVKVVMAWISSAVAVALVTILLQVWAVALPAWATWTLFAATFLLWFLPELRRAATRTPSADGSGGRWRSS